MGAILLLTIAKGEEPRFLCTHYQSQPQPLQPLPPVTDITGWTIQVTCTNPDGTPQFQVPAVVILGSAGTYEWDLYFAQTNITPKARGLEIWRVDLNFREQMGAGQLVITPTSPLADDGPLGAVTLAETAHVSDALLAVVDELATLTDSTHVYEVMTVSRI